MHGLRTSSVLVLDDSDDDALEIQKALALEGIGTIFVSGAEGREQPSKPLRGIRVAVLDIHLLAVESDVAQQVRHTKGIVNGLIDRENGPYVAVAWTSNHDAFTLFAEELQKLDCPPALTVSLEKRPVLDLKGRDRAEKILGAVGDAIAQAPPLEFANLWEQIVHDAANDTVGSLALAATPPAGEARSLAFFAALLNSQANPSALEDDANSVKALLAALNPVHFDKVEERSVQMDVARATAVAPIREKAKEPGGLSLAERAQLNAALMFDQRAAAFGPGRLYSFDEVKALEVGAALPGEQEIRCDTVDPAHLARAGELPVIFLEVSATCDHQQGKIQTARLLAGVVFAAATFKEGEKKKRLHSHGGDYLRILEPMRIPGVAGSPADDVRVVWNAHYPVSISASQLANREPMGRFREPLLADIRAWLGYQAGRPGYASIR